MSPSPLRRAALALATLLVLASSVACSGSSSGGDAKSTTTKPGATTTTRDPTQPANTSGTATTSGNTSGTTLPSNKAFCVAMDKVGTIDRELSGAIDGKDLAAFKTKFAAYRVAIGAARTGAPKAVADDLATAYASIGKLLPTVDGVKAIASLEDTLKAAPEFATASQSISNILDFSTKNC